MQNFELSRRFGVISSSFAKPTISISPCASPKTSFLHVNTRPPFVRTSMWLSLFFLSIFLIGWRNAVIAPLTAATRQKACATSPDPYSGIKPACGVSGPYFPIERMYVINISDALPRNLVVTLGQKLTQCATASDVISERSFGDSIKNAFMDVFLLLLLLLLLLLSPSFAKKVPPSSPSASNVYSVPGAPIGAFASSPLP